MNIAQTIPVADGWSMHGGGGWWIVGAAMMMLFMGGMMWMMMRGMGGDSSPRSSAPSESAGTTESPLEILERRFAEGDISVEEYRARREVLVNGTAAPSGDHDDKQLIGTHGAEGRQS